MKQNKSFLFLALFISMTYTLEGQNTNFVNSIVQDDLKSSIRGTNLSEVEGSPYLNNTWQQGYFIKKNGENTAGFEIRYNIYDHIVEFKFKGKELFLNPNTVEGFVLSKDGETRVFKNGFTTSKDNISKKEFLEILYEGKISLTRYHNAKFIKAVSPDYSTGKYIDEFIQEEHYYLALDDGSLKKVKLKRKDILKALPDKRDEIKEYADKYNLGFDEEKSLIQILKYYTVLATDD